jgi:hypothetical protein
MGLTQKNCDLNVLLAGVIADQHFAAACAGNGVRQAVLHHKDRLNQRDRGNLD